jgi:hypothetical protein
MAIIRAMFILGTGNPPSLSISSRARLHCFNRVRPRKYAPRLFAKMEPLAPPADCADCEHSPAPPLTKRYIATTPMAWALLDHFKRLHSNATRPFQNAARSMRY